MHGSENHAIMARVARLLAAEFYTGRQFEQYGRSAEEIRAEDEAYIDEFIMYRAGRAWGEFDSLGYGAEDLSILNTLYTYTKNDRLRKKAGMMLDMILLDMVFFRADGRDSVRVRWMFFAKFVAVAFFGSNMQKNGFILQFFFCFMQSVDHFFNVIAIVNAHILHTKAL